MHSVCCLYQGWRGVNKWNCVIIVGHGYLKSTKYIPATVRNLSLFLSNLYFYLNNLSITQQHR